MISTIIEWLPRAKIISAKTQMVFLIFEGVYGNMGAQNDCYETQNVNLASWPLNKVKTIPSHWKIHENIGKHKSSLPTY